MDAVRLRLPAGTDYGRVARVTTAAIARRHGFTYREVEDLRLAIDEAIIALLDDPGPSGPSPEATGAASPDPGAAVDITYDVGDGSVAITLVGANDRPTEAIARFHTLVTGLVDDASLDLEAGKVRLTKYHRA